MDFLPIILIFSCLAIVSIFIFLAMRRNKAIVKHAKIISENKIFSIDPTDAENFKRLKDLLENDKLFTNPNLTVNELSASLGLHPRKVSQLINHYAGVNFNQLVNKYRIAESKKLLSDANFGNLTMHGIAKEAGFNSRSVFHLAFKAEVGQTPSDFKKQAIQ